VTNAPYRIVLGVEMEELGGEAEERNAVVSRRYLEAYLVLKVAVCLNLFVVSQSPFFGVCPDGTGYAML
jgi:hypothetical protein